MIIKRTAFAIALAVIILAIAAGLKYSESIGLIGAEEARRTLQVLIGLCLAAYSNLMPKQLGRLRGSPVAAARAQAALRVGGWSMTLAGLAYSLFWAFAPLPVADTASMAVVASAMAVTLGFAGWAFTSCRAAAGETARSYPNVDV